jgi:hypothetical protein
MIRRITLAALALLIAVPMSIQAQDDLQMRLDRSTNAADPDDVPNIEFTQTDNGRRVKTGPAVVIWNPTSNQEGSYTLSATFTLLEPSGHTNYYGLVFGGRELDASSQNYLYFLVAQNGTFMLSHRANDEAVHSVVAKTGHDAIARPGDDGRSVNALEVRVGADEIELVVNGTVVHTQARSGMAARTDGIAGVRVNHQLDVEVSGFSTSN